MKAGGKDRTGVLSALLLNLSGHSPELIAQDYALTRIGTEAQREFLTNRLHDWLGPDAMDKPGVFELSSCDAIVMLAFVDWLDKEYGGAEGWLKKECKWTDDDIEKVRKNIMVQ
jgi:protein tyrosine/serine phosphatase